MAVEKSCGDNTLMGSLQLNAPEGSLLNCLGIQPIFIKDDFIERSSLCSVYHRHNKKNPTGLTKFQAKVRRGDENKVILKNCFPYEDADYEVIQKLLRYSDHFETEESLNYLMLPENKKLLKDKVLYQATYIKARTNFTKANFFISSNADLLKNLSFKFTELGKLKKYLIGENLLPKNQLIIGLRESSCFANPIIASPIIDRNDFDRICSLNDIDFDNMRPDFSKKYPLLERELDRYEIIQQYIDACPPKYWHIEIFNSPQRKTRSHYITIHFP